MKKILLATDFSDNSKKAVEYAIHLFGVSNVEYLLVNTYFEIPDPSTIVSTMSDYLHEQSLEGLKEQSKELKDKYPGINLHTHTYYGDPANTVRLTAKEEGIDFIVIGTKGASALENFLIGSNTLKMVKSVDTPTIMVPANWDHTSIDKIAFATDFQHLKNVHILRSVVDVAKKSKAEVVIVNVQEKNVDYKAALEGFQLHNELEKVKHTFEVEENMNVIEGIENYVQRNNIDLLAIVARKHSFFERVFRKSVTQELSKLANVPMLILHEESK